MMNLKSILLDTGFPITDTQEEQFERYRTLLLEKNKQIDLTAITETQEVNTKHFADSLTPYRFLLKGKNLRVLDIGSGAGFPGIPMKIYDDSLSITLVDSLKKRVDFLNEVIHDLGLSNVEAIHARAEDLLKDENYRESFDVVLSRAVAPLPTLLEYGLPGVKVNGFFIAMKGSDVKEEVSQADNAMQILGSELTKVDTFCLKGMGRSLLIFKKIQTSPLKYPRDKGKPRKRPL